MANLKRKRPTRQTTHANKRSKLVEEPSSSPDPSDIASESEEAPTYAVREILKEKKVGRARLFYVDWEDNPVTGEKYAKEWKKELDVGKPLVEEWDSKKAERQSGPKRKQAPLDPPPPPPKKQSRVIDSSPAAPKRTPTRTSSRSSPRGRPSSTHRTRAQSALGGQISDSSPVAAPRVHPSPEVQVHPPGSFDPQDYDPYSQLPATSQTVSSTLKSFLSNSQSSTYSGPHSFRASGVVLDSEGEEDDVNEVDGPATYIATTQEDTGTSATSTQQHILSTDPDLTCSVHSRPESPAPSIPETEPDVSIVEDSQREIPDTFDTAETVDTIVSTSQPAPEVQEEQQVPALGLDTTEGATVEVAAEEFSDKESVGQTTILDSSAEPSAAAAQPEAETSGQLSPASASARGERERQDIRAAQPVVSQTVGSQAAPLKTRATHSLQLEQISAAGSDFSTVSVLEAQTTPNVTVPESLALQESVSVIEQPAPETVTVRCGSRTSPETETNQADASVAEIPLNNVSRVSRALQYLLDGSVERRDFATSSNNSSNTELPSNTARSAEQQAQAVSPNLYVSTQEDISGSIRPTVEKDPQSSPQPRHDSSQQTPEHSTVLTNGPSPIPQPPVESLDNLDSNAPARVKTPVSSPRSNIRSNISMEKNDIYDNLMEAIAKHKRENPYVPVPIIKKSRRRLTTTGTRSPSTIPPESSPVAQTATSLRTVATSNAAAAVTEAGPSESASQPAPAPAPEVAPETDLQATTAREQLISGVVDSRLPDASITLEEDILSDSGSLFNDDLQLQPDEFIVPLPMDGRQARVYKDELANNAEIISAFVKNHKEFDPLSRIIKVLQRLHSIETHVDLIYGDPLSQAGGPSTQFQHQAQWSCENSIKFRFIGTLLHKLQHRDFHVILALERDDDRLFSIVEAFLSGKSINFNSPTRHHQADPARIEGTLKVTVLSSDASPIVQPPDLIICLNGRLEGSLIRQKNWSANPEKKVPVLHLVIPRAVDHIERYVSTTSKDRRRLHTILATLGQYHSEGDIGHPVYPQTPNSNEAADAIVSYLTSEEDSLSKEWPLPLIGSIKEEVEFASQQTLDTASTASPQLSSAKRPLEDDDSLDPSKRMRFTPQPGSHVSDSMPGTAISASKLREQLADMKRQLQRERGLRKAQEAQVNEERTRWETQQTAHEELSRTYNLLKAAKEAAEKRLEATARTESGLRERITVKATEHQELQAKFKALKDTLLASDDSKVVEITQLKKDLEAAKESEQRAIKTMKSLEDTQEYLKDTLRNAQDIATVTSLENDELRKKLVALQKEASGERTNLAKLHFDRVKEAEGRREQKAEDQNKILLIQIAALEAANQKLKAGRGIGAGTRAQSVGPRTRPGSRAASPLPGNRDRVTNLRNG